MANPFRQPTASSQPAWVRPYQRLWNQRGLVWGTVILGVALNLVASWLITPSGDILSKTPLGTVLRQPLPFVLGGFGLLIFTGWVWLVNRRYPAPAIQTPSPLPLTPERRERLVQTLDGKYNEQFKQIGTTRIVPRLRARDDVILPSPQMSSPSPGIFIEQAYDDAKRRLLILGAPGAGKSTLLLDLARKLLKRAKDNPDNLLPMILSLSSWAAEKPPPPLESWIIDELHRRYQVEARLGQTLLDECVLLLDGLDEVEDSARSQCIEAINHYQEVHDIPLVVCSRSQEYMTQQARLRLSRAVEIQPLQMREAIAYLERVGTPTAALRTTLRANPALRQSLTTLLMLNMLSWAYRDKTVKDLSTLSTVEEQQLLIFTCYVECKLEELVAKSHFTRQQTWQWLTWLARQMKKRGQKEFYLEDLQPSWLPRMIPVGRTRTAESIGWGPASLIMAWMAAMTGSFWLFFGILFVGVLVAAIRQVVPNTRHEIHPRGELTWSWEGFEVALIGGLIVWLIIWLIITLSFLGSWLVGKLGDFPGLIDWLVQTHER